MGGSQNRTTLNDYPGKHTYAESPLYVREAEILSDAEKAAILAAPRRGCSAGGDASLLAFAALANRPAGGIGKEDSFACGTC